MLILDEPTNHLDMETCDVLITVSKHTHAHSVTHTHLPNILSVVMQSDPCSFLLFSPLAGYQ